MPARAFPGISLSTIALLENRWDVDVIALPPGKALMPSRCISAASKTRVGSPHTTSDVLGLCLCSHLYQRLQRLPRQPAEEAVMRDL